MKLWVVCWKLYDCVHYDLKEIAFASSLPDPPHIKLYYNRTFKEDLAVTAKGGMETLRPAVQRVYMMCASEFRDTLKSFMLGYQEGIKQIMEGKECDKSLSRGQSKEICIISFLQRKIFSCSRTHGIH
ncbi:unnamed protein product [Musa hybrid cultivar]